MDEKLREALVEAGLSRYADDIVKLEMNSILIKHREVKDEEIPVGSSKFGGTPDLPPEFEWPWYTHDRTHHIEAERRSREFWTKQQRKSQSFFGRLLARLTGTPIPPPIQLQPEPKEESQAIVTSPLSFLAQANLSETAPYDKDKLLPESGILYFFYDALDQPGLCGPDDPNGYKVAYYEGDLSLLARTDPPGELSPEGRFPAFALQFSSVETMPRWESVYLDRLGMSLEEQSAYIDALSDALEATFESEETESSPYSPLHRMLGHPDHEQGDVFLSAELATGRSTRSDPPDPKMYEQATEWRLLFQLGSIQWEGYRPEPQMMWGDLGELFFCILSKDLEARDFSKVWMVAQCG